MKLAFACFAFLILATTAFAKDVAMVTALNGNAFVFGKGYSRPLKYGSKLQDFTEIMVEDDSVITIDDFAEHTFHLAGGSHIKFYNNVIEVKAGKIWVNSRNEDNKYIMQSVNGIASFEKGQFIFAFDNYNAKTQLLVMQGQIQFHNVLQSELGVVVESGEFSLVDKNYNQGLPRTPTRVGTESYKKMKFAFNGIDVLDQVEVDSTFGVKKSGPSRSLASVASSSEKGKLYFIPKKSKVRAPASVGGPMQYYENLMKKKQAHKKVVKSKAKVYILGGLDKPQAVKPTDNKVSIPDSSRMPASVGNMKIMDEINSAFDKSLEKAIDQNKRHPSEVNSLINDLKSYDQTYQKKY